MHLALIMDGNGRWASQRHLPRSAGHLEGVKACKRVILAAKKFGIEYLTLYAFSTENWKRPKQEVDYLMGLFENKLLEGLPFFKENKIKILCRGNIQGLPQSVQNSLKTIIEETNTLNEITVILAINYGGQDEIARACSRFIEKNIEKNIQNVTVKDIQSNLDLPQIPLCDLIARSAGEKRLSNFLLWDSAYAELLSINNFWPDWGELQIKECLEEFSNRTRKYGGL